MIRIFFVTNSYPQAGSHEKGFILEELRALVRSGASVTLVPVRKVTLVDPDMPPGVTLNHEFSAAFTPIRAAFAFFRVFAQADFWGEIRSRPSVMLRRRFWKEAIRLVQATSIFREMRNEHDLFYTYWFTADTIGLAKAAARPLITRAHGYDLYEDLPVNGGRIPFRRKYISDIDGVITLSEAASDYAAARYDIPSEKIARMSLGVPDQGPINTGNLAPDAVTFASCSFPSPNKRLGRIGETAKRFAELNSSTKVKWCHLGADAHELENASADCPPNLEVRALGRLSRPEIFDFYLRNDVSIFLNLSLSEGQPVSIMEAMSFGIPVLATAVGGVPEMLNEGGGLLVGRDEEPAIIADRITALMKEADWRKRHGEEARHAQRNKFSAVRNAERFVEFCTELAAARPPSNKRGHKREAL